MAASLGVTQLEEQFSYETVASCNGVSAAAEESAQCVCRD
jgi:hypothetical protein